MADPRREALDAAHKAHDGEEWLAGAFHTLRSLGLSHDAIPCAVALIEELDEEIERLKASSEEAHRDCASLRARLERVVAGR